MRSSTSPTGWTAIGEITCGDHNAADSDDARQLPALVQASLKRADHDGPPFYPESLCNGESGDDRPLASK
ncbi:hypothetical protein EAH75_08440 [Rhodanobacter glycinis]|uniref:Uncharacterized protein n=1 Tax=Rhodanobacter glycinis TaxID=582702 RepID=A0A502CEB2_9GAMM|nr:hypothetical protein EAH88_00015 [Rhodanobacter glycinis]TPG48478.1 hypothetical protein EAH75_08440 [Rhodanobacter glycinis]